jgi:endoribonuclease Dicer
MAWGGVTAVQEDDEVLIHNDGDSKGAEPQGPAHSNTWGGIQDADMFDDDDETAGPVPQPFEENPDEYSDSDLDEARAHEPATSIEKRRARNNIFKEYASKKTADVTEKELEETIQAADDEALSIQQILAKQEVSAQITNPRDYQTELFQKAKAENIIAVLDTGSGKTHIATLLLRHVLDGELEARAKGGPHKIAFFLVNSPCYAYHIVALIYS